VLGLAGKVNGARLQCVLGAAMPELPLGAVPPKEETAVGGDTGSMLRACSHAHRHGGRATSPGITGEVDGPWEQVIWYDRGCHMRPVLLGAAAAIAAATAAALAAAGRAFPAPKPAAAAPLPGHTAEGAVGMAAPGEEPLEVGARHEKLFAARDGLHALPLPARLVISRIMRRRGY